MAGSNSIDTKSRTKKQSTFSVEDDIYIINTTDFDTELMSLRYTTDKKVLVVGGANGSLMTVKPNTHEIIASFQTAKREESAAITCVREHPASAPGTMIAFATFASGHVRCWDIDKGQLKFSLKEPRQVLGFAAAPDQSYFITAGDDGILYVYDIATQKPVSKLESSQSMIKLDGHRTRIFAAAFHPTNPREAVSGGWDDTIYFWDVRQKHSTRRTGPSHICGSDALEISADGKEILTGAYHRNNQFQRWNYATGKLTQTIRTDKYNTSLYAVTYLSDSVVCAGGSDPALFRAVDVGHQSTTGVVKLTSGGVFSIHRGPIGLKYTAKKKFNSGRDKPENGLNLPRVAFCAGQHLFEVDFY